MERKRWERERGVVAKGFGASVVVVVPVMVLLLPETGSSGFGELGGLSRVGRAGRSEPEGSTRGFRSEGVRPEAARAEETKGLEPRGPIGAAATNKGRGPKRPRANGPRIRTAEDQKWSKI